MRIAPADHLIARVGRLRTALAARKVDALLVTNTPNIAYLTGLFASAAALIVTADSLHLITDGRYRTVLADRTEAFPAITPVVLEGSDTYDESIVDLLAPLGGLTVGFEASDLTVQRYRSIAGRLAQYAGWQVGDGGPVGGRRLPAGTEVTGLRETDGIVEELRLRKDAWETARLRDGAARLSDVAKCILPKALAGLTESAVAADIEGELRRAGFERPAFDTIVASGPNAALPHARASQRRIGPGDLVVIDFGGVLDGYCTDLSRTVIAAQRGSVPAHGSGTRERRLIQQVVDAQRAAFEALRPGGQPEAADAAARETLTGYGLAERFAHGTGHGLGLEVHEGPRVTRARADRVEPPLAPGMVITLEPGVYFPGWGGVRIEDDVLMTDAGAEWLTDVPR